MEMQKERMLNIDTFFNLVSLIPKEKRISFDNPLTILVHLLQKGIFFSNNIYQFSVFRAEK